LSERHVLLRDGTPVLIRRLMAEDAVLYHDFLSDVTPEDLRLRFFASMHAVSENLIDKLLHYDPARAMAFIAVEEHTRRMLDVVRLHDDTSGANAEFAIMVRSRLKGLKNVRGQVLWQNTTNACHVRRTRLSHRRRSGRLSLPKTRFVRTGDAILPRLHGRRCPRSGRSGARPVHPFRAKHEDATHYNRRRISQGSAAGALR
jgi:hypothetical protein